MDLSRFNEAQRKAIVHFTGPALVLAGPGSGKTTVLTKRIEYLVQEKNIPGEKILVVTFTKAAADEMKNRFLSQVSSGQAVRFGTFHAIFFSILRSFYKDLQIINADESKRSLMTALKILNLDPLNYEDYQFELSYIKNQGDIPDDYKPAKDHIKKENIISILEILRDLGIRAGKINFDDMAYETFRLFKENPSVLKIWRNKYSFFLLDEFQDICPVQYKLIQDMCDNEKNIFVVGDDDQSIYGFRGAGTEIMLGFPNDYKGASCINLDLNYRCAPAIINSACKVICENKKRFNKSQKAARDNGNDIELNGFVQEKDQTDWITDRLLGYKELGQLKDVALLFRKHGDYDKLLSRFKKIGIPYKLNEEENSIKETFIFKDIWQYLLFLDGEDSRSVFFNIMNKPERGIVRQSCIHETISEEKLCDFFKFDPEIASNIKKLYKARSFSKSLSVYSKINFIRKGLGYDRYLSDEASHTQREQQQYSHLADRLQESSLGYANKEKWFEHFDNESDENSIASFDKASDAVNILTYHASKGLEFKTVILPGVNEGNVPYNKADTPDKIEEERRMFYVAMTRAKDELFINYLVGTQEQPEKPSRFLKALGV